MHRFEDLIMLGRLFRIPHLTGADGTTLRKELLESRSKMVKMYKAQREEEVGEEPEGEVSVVTTQEERSAEIAKMFAISDLSQKANLLMVDTLATIIMPYSVRRTAETLTPEGTNELKLPACAELFVMLNMSAKELTTHDRLVQEEISK